MKIEEFVRGLFKRRKFGPISVSPFGLAVVFLLIAAPVVILVIFSMVWQDYSVQATRITPALLYAIPIAKEARLIREKTGKWPATLAEIGAAKIEAPRQVGRTLLLRNGEIRVVLASPHPFGNAGASLSLQQVDRGNEHFLECRAEGQFRFALPRFCKQGAEPVHVDRPPESAKAEK